MRNGLALGRTYAALRGSTPRYVVHNDPHSHMEKLQCKACGSYSMIPMDVVVDKDEDEFDANMRGEEQESRFYTCHVCGDNWLSVQEKSSDDCTITFVHQMGMSPELKRIAHMDAPLLLGDSAIDHWEYYLDDEEIEEDVWFEKLKNRRRVLKSVCSN